MNIGEIEKTLSEQVKKNRSPSVQYVIFNSDSILYEFRTGLADIKKQKPVDSNTRLNAYSVTKTFTALAILQLEEQGKLDIGQPIKQYLKNFQYSSNITVRQILAHAAGIPNPIPLSWIHPADEHGEFNRNVFFSRIFSRYNRVKTKPNSKFAYSNLGYVILGQLIEEVSGQRYEEYITANIINPLGIHPDDLGFEMGDIKRYAKGYHKRLSFSGLILGLFIDKTKYLDKAEGKWKPFKLNFINGPSYGGLIGTPDALVIYIRELIRSDCRLISGAGKMQLFTENVTNEGKATGMCLSWFRGQLDGHRYYTHAGGGGGFYCEIRIYPDEGIGSVVMFNRTGMKDIRFLDKTDRYFLSGQ